MPQLISFFLSVLVVPRRRGELVCIRSSCYRRRVTLDVMSFPRSLVISIANPLFGFRGLKARGFPWFRIEIQSWGCTVCKTCDFGGI